MLENSQTGGQHFGLVFKCVYIFLGQDQTLHIFSNTGSPIIACMFCSINLHRYTAFHPIGIILTFNCYVQTILSYLSSLSVC